MCVCLPVYLHTAIPTQSLWLLYTYMLFFSHTNKKKNIFWILSRPGQVPAVAAPCTHFIQGLPTALLRVAVFPHSQGISGNTTQEISGKGS